MSRDEQRLSHTPFAGLDKVVARTRRSARRREDSASEQRPAAQQRDAPPERGRPFSAGEIFSAEMSEVDPIERDNFVARRRNPPTPRRVDPDEEARAELVSLVSGEGPFPFDLAWSDEHIEGRANGVDRRVLRELRRGRFAVRSHIDLHGYTRADAKGMVAAFLAESRKRHERCVLIVHGRGLNSQDRIPVLKEALKLWLTRGAIARVVLAFCSAQPTDGGLGAVYVLLRK